MNDNEQWFRVSQLDSNTFVISEPNYWQKNNQYLLIGEKRALLIDSGPGKRDISAVTKQLCDVPIVVLGSHAHYDHISGHHWFDLVAVPDLPINRDQIHNGEYRPQVALRFALRSRHFHVNEWWPIGEPIDLGNRSVELLCLPGHSADSVGVLDRDHGYIFTGDFLCGNRDRVPLGAVFPTSSVSDYRESAQQLLDIYEGEQLFGGHYNPFPALNGKSIKRLLRVSEKLLKTRLPWPLSFAKSGNITLWTTYWALRK